MNRFLSFLLVLLMLAAASLTGHKTLLGYSVIGSSKESLSEPVDTISQLEDGTMVVHTEYLPGTIEGYAGEVPLDIKIKDGVITGVEALPNVETPGFFKRASKLLGEWDGKTPEEVAEMKIDAVSGATFSSAAIINNVNIGAAYYAQTAVDRHASIPVKLWVALIVTLAACVLPLFVKNKVYHTVQMIANVVVLGFWSGQFLDYAVMLRSFADGVALPGMLVIVVMLIAAFVYPLFGKPQYYCTHICPLGSAQQLMGSICGFKVKISARVVKCLDWFRKILWACLMLLLWCDTFTSWMDLELFQAFQFRSASWWIIGAAILFIGLSAIVTRPYCRFVCPTGSLFKRSDNIG